MNIKKILFAVVMVAVAVAVISRIPAAKKFVFNEG